MSLKKLFQRPFSETLNNIKGRVLSVFNSSEKRVNPPAGMTLVFQDNFETFRENAWRMSQPWGDFHPNFLNLYYGREEVVQCMNNELHLRLKHQPRVFYRDQLKPWQIGNHDLPAEFTIPYCAGLVVSKGSWKYGWFEAEVMLPHGMNLWPAFWLSGAETWPPEIDIFEAYSNHSPKYGRKILNDVEDDWQIQPNLHYGVVSERTKEMYGSYNVKVKDCTEKFVQYACHWSKDFIRIYYNGVQVFETVDRDILQWFNRSNARMNVIFNNGVIGDAGVSKPPSESVMRIRNFKVYV